MEIFTAPRQITLDDLDLLDQEEEMALFQVTEAAQQETIREQFSVRRQALSPPPAKGETGHRGIQVPFKLRQYTFHLAPPDFVNQMQALDFARKHGLWDGHARLGAYTFGLLLLLYRITSWSGFEAQGALLPCTPENKVLVFGQAFTVIQALARKLADVEAAEAKNSGTSAAG